VGTTSSLGKKGQNGKSKVDPRGCVSLRVEETKRARGEDKVHDVATGKDQKGVGAQDQIKGGGGDMEGE